MRAAGYTSTANGRFKGGWTTRHYGRPDAGIHAVQMELAQSTYLTSEAAPWTYDATKAARLRPHLTSILTALADLATTLGGPK
jgi:formiminoglutamase